MFYNFVDIKFRYDTTDNNKYNEGWFTKIINGSREYSTGETNKTGAELFKTKENYEIRTLTLPELNKAIGRGNDSDCTEIIDDIADQKGMYRLDQLKVINGIDNVLYNSGVYWVASPDPTADNLSSVCHVYYFGSVSKGGGRDDGVRSVVKIPGLISKYKQ